MSTEGHLNRLIKEHKNLDDRIKNMISQPGCDYITLHELKKQKLRVKDRIDILRRTEPSVHSISGDIK